MVKHDLPIPMKPKRLSTNDVASIYEKCVLSMSDNKSWDFSKSTKEPQCENTDVDSLGTMFSDLIQEVVVGASSSSSRSSSGSKGTLNDFVDFFLEKSADGFLTGNHDSDPSLEESSCEGTIH